MASVAGHYLSGTIYRALNLNRVVKWLEMVSACQTYIDLKREVEQPADLICI